MLHHIIDWFVKKHILNNPVFLCHVKKEFVSLYKSESLKIYRVWGEESRLHIGMNVHLNNAVINTVSGHVHLGENSFLGHSVALLTGTHDIKSNGIARQQGVPESGRDIVLGQGVWIGSNVTVLGPSKIGDNAVIAAGSVLNGDAECNALYAGNPALKVCQLNGLEQT